VSNEQAKHAARFLESLVLGAARDVGGKDVGDAEEEEEGHPEGEEEEGKGDGGFKVQIRRRKVKMNQP